MGSCSISLCQAQYLPTLPSLGHYFLAYFLLQFGNLLSESFVHQLSRKTFLHVHCSSVWKWSLLLEKLLCFINIWLWCAWLCVGRSAPSRHIISLLPSFCEAAPSGSCWQWGMGPNDPQVCFDVAVLMLREFINPLVSMRYEKALP